MPDRVVNLDPHKNFALVPGVIFEHADLTGNELATYTTLRYYAYKPSIPSQGELAGKLHLSRGFLVRVFRSLEQKGLITRQGSTSGMTYVLTDPHMWWAEHDPQLVTQDDKLVTQDDKQPRSNKEVVKEEISEGRTSSPAPRKERKPSPIWDALLEAGLSPPATPTERRLLGKVVSELKTAGATPEEVLRRCRAYRREWPDAELTGTALIKHWSRFGAKQIHDARPALAQAHQPFKESRETCEHGNLVGRRCGECYEASKVHRDKIHALLHPEESIV